MKKLFVDIIMLFVFSISYVAYTEAQQVWIHEQFGYRLRQHQDSRDNFTIRNSDRQKYLFEAQIGERLDIYFDSKDCDTIASFNLHKEGSSSPISPTYTTVMTTSNQLYGLGEYPVNSYEFTHAGKYHLLAVPHNGHHNGVSCWFTAKLVPSSTEIPSVVEAKMVASRNRAETEVKNQRERSEKNRAIAEKFYNDWNIIQLFDGPELLNFYRNPFAFKGKSIILMGRLAQMTSPTRGIFTLNDSHANVREIYFVVEGLPKGFNGQGGLVIVGSSTGTAPLKNGIGGNFDVPRLSYQSYCNVSDELCDGILRDLADAFKSSRKS